MAYAWLESLSEDWVSQGGSDHSFSQLPALRSATKNEATPSPKAASRIPRWRHPGSAVQESPRERSMSILNERSANDINISQKRLSTKGSHGRKTSHGSRHSRSVSEGTTGSVVHNSTNLLGSQSPGNAETPEWRRRLVYGEVEYGEQRDLFCSAAVGLQDMFKPPQSADAKAKHDKDTSTYDTTLPSSPPRGAVNKIPLEMEEELNIEEEEEDGDYPEQVTPSPSPRRPQREIKYKANTDDSFNSSMISNGSVRQPAAAQPEPRDDSIYRDTSCLSVPPAGGARKASGYGDTINEDFSPIFIGKHDGGDGKVSFAPLEIPADQLRQRLERLRLNQMLLEPQSDFKAAVDTIPEEPASRIETTDDYIRNGGFINMVRGGRSAEGSFRFRALSPDLGVDSSEMLPEESLQASTPKQFPTVRTDHTNAYLSERRPGSPTLPPAPFPSPEKRQPQHASGLQLGGSPLKLFGPYDTFTNQTLLRRISQFEQGLSGRTSRQSRATDSHDDSINPQPQPQPVPRLPRARTASQFGVGEFEGYEFPSELSYASLDDSEYPGKENLSPNPPLPPSHILLLPRNRVQSKNIRNISHKSRIYSNNEPDIVSSHRDHSLSPPTAAPSRSGTPKRDIGSDGKRPRTSPSKDPTPKRRRTLHKSDIAFGTAGQLKEVDIAHQNLQQLFAKDSKRVSADPGKGKHPDNMTEPSDRRPSTSYSTQQHSSTQGSPSRAARNPPKAGVTAEPERKPSMRTQDFVDQAAQIMAMIRNQVVQPGLGSVEESEAENGPVPDDNPAEDSDGSTAEPFSRPPSRDGKPVPRFPQRQEDPKLVSHLKKYQEMSDMGDIISSSVRSMGLAKDAVRAAQEVERMIQDSGRGREDMPLSADGDMVSDMPNVRISTRPQPVENPASPSPEFPSQSSGRSSTHTFPTGSSRGSDSRKVIMPQSVSHLIPDRIGGMYLDKQNNIWVKKKEPKWDSASGNPPDDSEDDPFASIPDLTVDVTKELQQLRLSTGENEAKAESSGQDYLPLTPSRSQPLSDLAIHSTEEQSGVDIAALTKQEIDKLEAKSSDLPDMDEDSHHSDEALDDKISIPASTTRRRHMTISFSSPIASIIQDMLPEDLDSLEDDPELDRSLMSSSVGTDDSPAQNHNNIAAPKNLTASSMRSHRPAQAQGSFRGPSFTPRPVSRIDEQDEDSTVEVPMSSQTDRQISIIGDNTLASHRSMENNTSLGFVMNQTPGNNAVAMKADDSLLIGRNIGRLSLSPLSEFTMNNPDQSFGLEVSYVMGQRHMATGGSSKRVLSMTVRNLVDRLSHVEPNEPYWEDMTELDLHGQQLASLHMLDEFCSKLVTLDVSRNALGHLEGVPIYVRQLKASNNMLTELTSWDHLMNLQYIDISNNEVKSLSALKKLVHLRSLKADHNQLTSLDGLESHDGLLTLRARNNLIEDLDFTGIKLERLTELDLESNKISSVRNLELLPALSRLNLAHNQLQVLEFSNANRTLRHLDLGDNALDTLDICHLSNLQTLHADRNCLHQLSGFRSARRLDSLSLREQRGDRGLDLGFLRSACEIRKLFLSGNYMARFELRTDFLNLQLLELANCGLSTLPKDLGQLMPNLRTLNVNFNAISDLSALRFIPRLKKLLAAGNRLADSTSVTELLTDFPHLVQLDLRDNPITQGFYPPIQLLVAAGKAAPIEPFTLPDAEAENDTKYTSRLDETTRLRRRLHEVVFVASCKRLRKLDGLRVSCTSVLTKDEHFQKLVNEGLVPELGETTAVDLTAKPIKDGTLPRIPSSNATTEPPRGDVNSSQWNAEDSFA